jgi:SAM-dependent methyltransferase
MSEVAVDAGVAALPVPEEASLLETGCGTGAILRRALTAHPTASGLGIDLDPEAIAMARRDAAGLAVRFVVGDAGSLSGAFDAVINVASSHAHGGFPHALGALRALAPAALFGEGFWQRDPSPEFLDALGGATADELANLAGLRAAIGEAGWEIVRELLASATDWARYEEALAANAERHGSPESLAYARRIRDRRALADSTGTLGFALFVLRAS